MVNIQSATAEIRRGKKDTKKKEERRKIEITGKIKRPVLLHRAAIMKTMRK